MIGIPLNDSLAEQHYQTIKLQLITRIENILKSGNCKVDSNQYNVSTNTGCKEYLEYLIEKDTNSGAYPNLKKLIVARPDELIDIIIETKRDYKELFYKGKSKKEPNWSHFNRIIYNVFVKNCYEKSEIFNKDSFIKNIGLKTCPYCNRNYTFSVEDGKIKPQLDHFHPKSDYPFLAMSYYNLIPSCPVCNGLGAKEQNDPLLFNGHQVVGYKLVNPYSIQTDNFKFSYSLKTPCILSEDSIEIQLDAPHTGYKDIFKLEELYNLHTDHVEELILKSQIKYPRSYSILLEKITQQKIAQLPKSMYFRLLIGNYIHDDELHKRPLSKLYRDIALQLGIITKEDLKL